MTVPHPRHVERIRKMKQRQAVRAWEYRQRRASKGVWDRLRAVLARSERAYALDEDAKAALRSLGVRPHPVGGELQPVREYYVLPATEGRRVASLPELQVGLGAAFLDAPRVALVYFEGLAVTRHPLAFGDAPPLP